MNSDDARSSEHDVDVIVRERDEWRQRAEDSQRRLDEHLALEAQRADARREATELLRRAHNDVMSERDEWRRRALSAEAQLAQTPKQNEPDEVMIDLPRFEALEKACDELRAQRDGWRQRALQAEHDLTHDNAGDATGKPPARPRSRGNWLR